MMQNEEVDFSQEFNSPDVNLLILLKEMEDELRLMQLDLTEIQSPILRGLAQQKYLSLKEKYFYLLAKDLELLKMYEQTTETESLEDNPN